MTTLRIIYDNAADRGVITASSTAGSLAASNLKIDRKSKIWRSVGTSATLTCAWPTLEVISGVVMPFCNLSGTATIQVRVYDVTSGGSPIFISPVTLAAPIVPLGYWAWGQQPLGVNAFSYGYTIYARLWFGKMLLAKRVEIDIVDTSNTSGYIDVSRLVVGNHWSPRYNTSFGIPVTYSDQSTNMRAQSGDLIGNNSYKSKKISIDLNWLTDADRSLLASLYKNNGTSKPIFMSVFPNNTDPAKEQNYQIYGKLPSAGQITHPMHTIYSSQLELEEA